MRRERLPRRLTTRRREEDTMKNVCWALFGFSALLLLIGVYSKFAGQGSWVMDFQPVAWWRESMAAVIYSIALALITRGEHAGA